MALLFAATGPLTAQNEDDDWLIDDGWIDQSNFDAFQQQSEKVFNDFRDSANARFARELARQWQPVELQKPIERPHKPEPKTPPVAPKPDDGSHRQPAPAKLPHISVIPTPIEPIPQPRKMPTPTVPNDMRQAVVPFYHREVKLDMPQEDLLSSCILASDNEQAVSKMWKTLTSADVQACIDRLLLQQQCLRLNDWGMYDITSRLAAKMFPDDNRRVVATVFLLNQMEYDAKIARTDNGLACLLALDCMVYGNPFVTLNNKRYYIFMPDGSHKDFNGKVYTYNCTMTGAHLPIRMAMGETPALPINKPANTFNRTVAGNNVKVCVNENLMDFYNNYPQVEMSLYANAEVDSLFKEGVEKYFRPMVKGKKAYAAVTTLLNYMHYGFSYATDDEQFGYEKPFFCEENFYYPKNDCEDRSILFSYLVRYLLGLDVVLLDYPNHIAAAVCFPEGEVRGAYYELEGKRYVICDPTYIGASIGMCQPAYKGVKAGIIKLKPIQ